MTQSAPETGGNNDGVIDQGLGLMPQNDQGQQELQLQGQQQPNADEVRFNQAWNPLLSQVPQSLHSIITPHLKQWDRNYNDGIQKVHSQYAGYKPFLDSQVAPEDINNAMLVYNALNENPQSLIEQLIDYYKYEMPQMQGEQGQEQQLEEEIPYDITQHPEFQRMSQLVELLGQNTLQQNDQILQQQADEQLDQEFAQAREKHGDFDETWVAQAMYLQEMDIDTAVAAYQQHVQQIVGNYRPAGAGAPVLMGGGGGVPSQQTNVSGMTAAQRKALIANTLAQAAQQANGG